MGDAELRHGENARREAGRAAMLSTQGARGSMRPGKRAAMSLRSAPPAREGEAATAKEGQRLR